MSVLSVIAGLVTGILSAWGVGGGSLLIVYMTIFSGIPQQTAQGINLLYFLPTSSTALWSHLKNNLVDKTLAWPAIVTGVLTTCAAALIVTNIDTQLVRKIFGVFIIIIGIREIFRLRKKKECGT